jgi:hypothetical protein
MRVAVYGPVGLMASTGRAMAMLEIFGVHGAYLDAGSFGW